MRKENTSNVRLMEWAKIMEIEIVIAVLATGLGLIGGMLVIWRDYRGHRHQGKGDVTAQTSTEGSSSPSQEEILIGDQN
ncbi:MAG: hypothetical protein JSU59_11740 [Nitrospirota bacterium]|nr:MAG: hypothetical protein JSU59_11740 [Nitrospirota bacterium]